MRYKWLRKKECYLIARLYFACLQFNWAVKGLYKAFFGLFIVIDSSVQLIQDAMKTTCFLLLQF